MPQSRPVVPKVRALTTRLRLAAGAGLSLGLAALVALWVLHGHGGVAGERVTRIAAPETLSGESAEKIARRAAAAHADVTAVWRNDFRRRLGRGYADPEVVNFSRSRPSPCAGVAGASGPFYCGLDRTVSFDLAFLERLGAQLRGEGNRAVALVVARIGAEHVQAELAILGDAERRRRSLDAAGQRALDTDLVLQADCLTGVWARRAESRIGLIEPGAWGRVVAGARTIAPEAAASARLDVGAIADREAAFARGYDDAQIRDCLVPGLEGVLG